MGTYHSYIYAIRNQPVQLESVRESMMQRLNGYAVANGQHFEQLM